jgi:hypothetical protein
MQERVVMAADRFHGLNAIEQYGHIRELSCLEEVFIEERARWEWLSSILSNFPILVETTIDRTELSSHNFGIAGCRYKTGLCMRSHVTSIIRQRNPEWLRLISRVSDRI